MMRFIFSLVFVLSVPACFGGGGEGGDRDPIKAGDEEFRPPAEDMGTGKPSGATTYTCERAEDCGYWFCECSDYAVVNTASCTNGYCLDAATTCPEACEYFNHGGFSGRYGGGPMEPETPDSECGEQGTTNDICWSCVEDQCCDESASCYGNSDCLDYWDCRYACNGDFLCLDDCAQLHPWGVDDYDDLEYCLLDRCGQDC